MVDAAQDDRDDDEIRRTVSIHGGRRYGRTEWERRNLAPPPVRTPPAPDLATLTAERDRYAAALDRIASMSRVSADGVTVYHTDAELVEAMQAEAERAREGTK